ncbi:PQQ-dependent sugar dehydrogenase [Rhodomicrobium vannielii]|nr:PQQ-dependent sugar dehydrogenase [Rhodomicrobium vannielii]
MTSIAEHRLSCLALAVAVPLTLALSLAAPALAETTTQILEDSSEPEFTVTRIAGPLDHPWSMAFLPDGRLLVTERWGELQVVTPGAFELETITGLPPRPTEDHAGLMDVILDPDYVNNRTIYLSYVHGTREASTVRVMKARLNLDKQVLEDRVILFDSAPATFGLEEFGGRMVIDKDGYLFLTLGDRYDRRHAQNLSEDYGHIIRIRTDGSIPEDNPFVGRPGARPGIWSYGHRNPQGLAIDPETGTLWAHEHGPMGGDELNIIKAGANYGWPVITYGREYDDTPINNGQTEEDGMEQPVHYWVPSIAPSGMTVYEGHVSEWKDTIWLGALVGQMLVKLKMDHGKVVGEDHYLKDKVGRIRDVRTGPDGFIYFCTDSEEGGIYRVEPVAETASSTRAPHEEVR